MSPAETHAAMLAASPVLPDGVPYGIAEFGGDIPENALCAATYRHLASIRPAEGWGTVLEIGAGGGRWTKWLAPHAQNLCCVDRTKASAWHIDALKLTPRPMHLLAQHGVLPTANGSPLHHLFGLVFSYDTFCHLDHVTIRTYIQSIGGAITDGGVVVIHHASPVNISPEQPVDHSGCWIMLDDHVLDSYCLRQSLHLTHSIRASEGYGSRVAFYRCDRGAK